MMSVVRGTAWNQNQRILTALLLDLDVKQFFRTILIPVFNNS